MTNEPANEPANRVRPVFQPQVRSKAVELMEALSLDQDPVEYRRVLREVDQLNRWTGRRGPLLKFCLEMAKLRSPARPFLVADLGCGGGDLLQWLVSRLRHCGYQAQGIGVDLNEGAIAECRARHSAPWFEFVAGDAVQLMTEWSSAGADRRPHVVLSSLFMHHLDDEQIVEMIRSMTAAAQLGWYIDDLHRHPIAFHFIRVATRMAGFSRVVQHDAPVSVARSFRSQEWYKLIDRAGLPVEAVRLDWKWAFRLHVSYRAKSQNAKQRRETQGRDELSLRARQRQALLDDGSGA